MGLNWSLAGSLVHYANTELDVALEIVAPEAGTYYLMGALYTLGGEFIPGTIFGIVVPEGSSYGIISTTETKSWPFALGEAVSLQCKLMIDRTGVILSLFLMKMAGEYASLEDDVIAAQVSATLTVPTTPIDTIVQVVPALLLLIFFSMMIEEVTE